MSTSTTDEHPAEEVIDLEPTLHVETAEPWVHAARVFFLSSRTRDARGSGDSRQLFR